MINSCNIVSGGGALLSLRGGAISPAIPEKKVVFYLVALLRSTPLFLSNMVAKCDHRTTKWRPEFFATNVANLNREHGSRKIGITAAQVNRMTELLLNTQFFVSRNVFPHYS